MNAHFLVYLFALIWVINNAQGNYFLSLSNVWNKTDYHVIGVFLLQFDSHFNFKTYLHTINNSTLIFRHFWLSNITIHLYIYFFYYEDLKQEWKSKKKSEVSYQNTRLSYFTKYSIFYAWTYFFLSKLAVK